MDETLADILHKIDGIPDYAIDKPKACIAALKHWANESPLVHKLQQGTIELPATFIEITKKIGGYMVFIPHYVGRENMKKIEEMAKVTGHITVNNYFNLLVNPVAFAGLSALAILAISYPFDNVEYQNKETSVLIVAAFGALFGAYESALKLLAISTAKKEADYIQSIFEKYKKFV